MDTSMLVKRLDDLTRHGTKRRVHHLVQMLTMHETAATDARPTSRHAREADVS
jgi:hypothetical protein